MRPGAGARQDHGNIALLECVSSGDLSDAFHIKISAEKNIALLIRKISDECENALLHLLGDELALNISGVGDAKFKLIEHQRQFSASTLL